MTGIVGQDLSSFIGDALVGPYDVCPGARIYWDGIAKGKILLPRCRKCGKHSHPRQESCENCFSDALDWREIGGGGEIYTFSTIWRAPDKKPVPYTLGLVMVDEGVCLFAEIEQSPAIAIGKRVVPFFDRGDSGTLLKFRVADAAAR